LQKSRLFGFSLEGGTSLPVCVSHQNWARLFERKDAKGQRRKESPKVEAFEKYAGTVREFMTEPFTQKFRGSAL
jgi:hypothetical protein